MNAHSGYPEEMPHDISVRERLHSTGHHQYCNRWVEFTPGIPEVISESATWAIDDSTGITIYWHINGVSAIKRRERKYWIYETDFQEALEIDVTELQPGDVIWHCMDDGPVTAHDPYSSYPETEQVVWFDSGNADRFGKPQKIQVLRGGQF